MQNVATSFTLFIQFDIIDYQKPRLLSRGNPGSADVLRLRKENNTIKIEIRNHFYSHKSVKGLNFEIRFKKIKKL